LPDPVKDPKHNTLEERKGVGEKTDGEGSCGAEGKRKRIQQCKCDERKRITNLEIN